MDILGIGFAEFVFILVIAMMVFGPRRLPEVAAKAGKIVADLRNMSQGLMIEWQREINAATQLDEELKKTRQELVEVKNDLTQAKKAVVSDTAEVAKAIAPPALAAQAIAPPAAKPNPAPAETPPPAAETDAAAPVPHPPEPAAEAVTPANGPQPEPSAEAKIAPQKTAPAPVSRPPLTAKNGVVEASAQNSEKDPEKAIDEQ